MAIARTTQSPACPLKPAALRPPSSYVQIAVVVAIYLQITPRRRGCQEHFRFFSIILDTGRIVVYAMGMSKKRPKSKRPDKDLVVPTSIHARLKDLADSRRMWLGGLTAKILEAYLDQLDTGTDWLEVSKAGKGDG